MSAACLVRVQGAVSLAVEVAVVVVVVPAAPVMVVELQSWFRKEAGCLEDHFDNFDNLSDKQSIL